MTLSLLRKGDRAVMLCYLGAPRLDRVPAGIAVVTSSAGVTDTPTSLEAARKLAGLSADAPLAACGYSGGCQPVRSLLLAAGPEAADAWVTIDGTADRFPTLTPARIQAWAGLAAAARAGSVLWAATCIQQDYVEHLQSGAFASTRRVLQAATGLDLHGSMARAPSGIRADGTLSGPPAAVELAHRYVDGALVVESYASSHTDAAEHRAQAQVVYPRLIEDVVAPWLLERRLPGAEGSIGASVFGYFGDVGRRLRDLGQRIFTARVSLGERALAIALKELGVAETPGPKHTQRILDFLKVCIGRPERGAAAAGKPLGLASDEIAWCAAFQSWCMLQAANEGDVLPHEPRAAVWEIVADARERGTFRDVSTGYRPNVGDLGIYKRAGGDPRIKGQNGHVDRVETIGAEAYTAIGGNENNQVRREAQRYDASDIAGWIVCS
ncbi:MAG: CHAP domain-containing protein [Polyangiaceae bacterium]|nr:CHAP domain-containing protein [Polyangiaceae bacterium]